MYQIYRLLGRFPRFPANGETWAVAFVLSSKTSFERELTRRAS